MATDKVYIGTGKAKTFQDGGEVIKFRVSSKDLAILQGNLRDGWVGVDICRRRQPSDKGQTHYGTLDTWQPKERRTDQQPAQPAPKRDAPDWVDDTPDDQTDNLPF